MDIHYLVHECHDPETLQRLFYYERYSWLALSQDMAAVISTDGMFEDVNTHWEMATGHSRETMQHSYLTEYIHFDDREQALAALQALITADIASTSFSFRFLQENGDYCRTNWNVVYSPDHESYFCVVRCLSSQVKPEQLAYRDALTGLKNRLALDEQLPKDLSRARDIGTGAAVIFLDLDGFKQVNDSLGHKAGDSLLMRTAKRLTDCIGNRGSVYRLAGDEFIVVLARNQDKDTAKAVATEIVETLAHPYNLEEASVRTSASLGLALFPDDANHPVDLLDKADKAMYHVKRNGKNGLAFYAELPQLG